MNQSLSLFKLIKTLSSSERRYITIAIKSHLYSASYLRLFKEMYLQKNYDEARLKQQFKKEPFIKHFAVTKNQLFKFILTVLRGYHKGSSLDFKLKELLLDSAVLHQKMLYNESWQALQHARELALKFEDWKVLLEILYKEFMLISKVIQPAKRVKEFERINKELDHFLNSLNRYEALAHPIILMSALIKKHEKDGGLNQSAEAKALMLLPVLNSDYKRLPLRAQMLYLNCWSSYLVNCCDYTAAEGFLLKQVALFEQNNHFIQWIPGNYLLALQDLLTCCYLKDEFEAASKIIKQLLQLTANTQMKKVSGPRFKLLLFSWTFRYEIGIVIHKGMPAEQVRHIKEQEPAFLQQMPSCEATARMETLLALAGFYFYASDYKKAAKMIEKLMADPSVNTHRQLSVIATALQAILHFKDDDREMVKYLLKRMKSCIKAETKISATEKKLVEMISDFSVVAGIDSKRKMLLKYLDSFSGLKKRDIEKQYYRFFDVCFWLEHYLAGLKESVK